MEYIYLALLMTCAGFIDSLAGGGGIITLPSYLAFGLSPAHLLGTNKLSSCMGTLVAAYKFRKKIKINKKLVIVLAATALIFSACGAAMSRLVNPGSLKWIVLIVVPLSAYFVISNKELGRTESRREIGYKKSNRAAMGTAAGVALYDGFLGPGAGTMYAVMLVKYSGLDMLQATAVAKILNFCSNIFALAFFLCVGAVDIKLGLIMGVFNIIGSSIGVYVGKKRGHAVIRPLIILVSCAIIIKYIWDFMH
ncbi:hypothetical protein Dip518_000536 [Parelusimicrobium proximum]|uniref:sulfite exporter TauE/SafE family protein n=1 Tax=Parelusimicrobium proximum TaxID=3228953 RepID=UPI003D17276A